MKPQFASQSDSSKQKVHSAAKRHISYYPAQSVVLSQRLSTDYSSNNRPPTTETSELTQIDALPDSQI